MVRAVEVQRSIAAAALSSSWLDNGDGDGSDAASPEGTGQ